ncbi:MAG: hypothetical protein LBI20_00720, partial [Holosporales bacterium]|nr:hypothetical protein [Holosporales bacterium]
MTKSKLAPLVLLFTMIQLVEAMETDVVLDPRGPLVVSPKVFVDLPVTLPEAPESPVARGWPNYPVFLANAWGDHAHIPSALAELVPTLGEMLCNFRLNPALMPNAPQNGSPAEINAFALFGAWRCLALLLPDVWDYPIPFLIRLANLLTMPVVSVFCDLRPRAKAACVSDLLYFMANGKFVEYFLVCRGVDPAFRNVLVAEPEAIEFFFELCQDRDRGMQAALAWASTVSSYRTFKVLEDSRKKKMKTRVQNPGIKSEFVAQQPGGQVTLARQVFTAASREVDRINFQTLVGLDLWWWLCEQYENYLTYQIENWKYKNQPPLPGVAPATTPVVVPPPLEEAILDGTAVFVDRGPVDWDAADVVPYPDPSAAEDLSIPTPVSGDPAPDGDETPGSPEAAAGTAEPDPAAAEDLSIPTPVSGDPAPDAYGTPVRPETAAGPADPDPAAAEDLPIPTPVSGEPEGLVDRGPVDWDAADVVPYPDPSAEELPPTPAPVSGEPEGLVDRGPVDWDAADVVPYPDPSAEELPPTPTPVSDDPAPDGDDTPVSPETA